MFQFGLQGLAGAIPLSLSVDNTTQEVGKTYKYRIVGAPPGATLYWTSFKDGIATGEHNANYEGGVVDSNGTVETSWTPAPEHVGLWTKQLAVQDAQGAWSLAQVQFRVVPANSAAAPPQQAQLISYQGGGDTINVFGYDLPSYAVYGGGLLAAWFIWKKVLR